MVRRALALFRAVLVVVSCGALVLLYFLAGLPGPPTPPGSAPAAAHQRLLAYLHRPLDNTSHDPGKGGGAGGDVDIKGM